MKSEPRIGMAAERRLTVDATNRIPFVDARMPAVLATPFLIAELEYAAHDAVAGCLEDHEQTVGTYVEVEHLAPVPEGLKVTCRARVILVSGAILTFTVDAHDGTSRSRRAFTADGSSTSTASPDGSRGNGAGPDPSRQPGAELLGFLPTGIRRMVLVPLPTRGVKP